ncbi:hypothetical protein GSI_10296 [Ganoderma sinense ZZ0214-1]|uniref:Transporter n=1 Tax=Ganoderma sinense ZZ0214-1 TaxID=1077348 RepID=A0A2G8S079_9APHY|nr:hypothetical protein GSI_10296 [Ganoderma sinense ZZ0214-1]
MFFSKLSVIAAVAFGALASALPLDLPVVGSLPAVGSLPVGSLTGVVGSLPVGNVLSGIGRRDTPKSVAVILTGVQAQLEPITASLTFITTANATVEAVTGPANEIISILGGAVVDLKALVGLDASVILASVDGTVAVTVDVLAGLLAHVIVSVFFSLGAVVHIAGSAIDGALFTLLATVGAAVGTVVALVFQLVVGLLVGLDVAVVGLIKAVVPVIVDLNVHVLISLFKF